ncbi:MAG: hypothetical protein ILO36_01840 [Abditibacteriota bacterium]|nr:hypothetical protein [Abditibacteriota bacterium]
MKKKIVIIICILAICAAAAYYYHGNFHKMKTENKKSALLSIAIAEAQKEEPASSVPVGAAPEGAPLLSVSDAPVYLREYLKDFKNCAYKIYDGPDIVVIDSEPSDKKNYSVLYKTGHLRSSSVIKTSDLGGCILEQGKDILWLKNKDGLFLWGADLNDSMHSETKRDRVYDASSGDGTYVLSLITAKSTAMHRKEYLALDTLAGKTEDGRAVMLRKKLKEYLRSFNTGKEDPVPTAAKKDGGAVKAVYADGHTETIR